MSSFLDTPSSDAPLESERVAPDHKRSMARGVRAFLALTEAKIGLAMFGVILIVIVAGPLVTPYHPETVGVGATATGSSPDHLLGTDSLGRDLLSRVLAGGRSVLLIPAISISVAMVVSAALGITAGYRGGRFDNVLMAILDVLLAIPPILLVFVIIAGFGRGDLVVTLAVAWVYIPSITRVLRSATQAERPQEYILAARARGDSLRWIIMQELLPNLLPTLLVEIALRLTFAILFIATLSFLGLGVQPPTPNWGVMASENRDLLYRNANGIFAPVAALAWLAISVNVIADALTRFFGVED